MSERILLWMKDGKTLVFCDKGWGLYWSRNWHIRNGYLWSTSRPYVCFHRILMNAQKGQFIDHVNGWSLDNRLSNMRFADHSQNGCNRRPNKNKRFKGVCRRGNKYTASIQYKKVAYLIGLFDTEEEAARQYDTAARRLHGEFARTNFDSAGREQASHNRY